MHKPTKLLSLLTCVVMLFTFTACSKNNDNSSVAVTKKTESSVSDTTKETKETAKKTEQKQSTRKTEKAINILTGNDNISAKAKGKRPVAVMVNNIDASMPQYGIYKADMLFECPVEGGITRLMALYSDYTSVPKVCSVRSCRYYFAYFASSFDAIYLHWGIDKIIAENKLAQLKIDHIDGNVNTTLFKRDQERLSSYSLEHSGYCDGSLIPSEVKNAGIRTDLKNGYNTTAFSFLDKTQAISKQKANSVVINFSDYYSSAFNYDSKAKNYKKLRNGEKHIDASNNKQLVYSNVIVLESNEIKVVNKDNGLLSLDWKGGTGYCFSGGAVKKIKWKKDSELGKLKLTDENGNTLKINKGKTYIGVTKKGTLSYS